MANVYYSDTLGTDLNVYEKKTKGGEPFYYIYLNKTKITEGDVGKLTKLMQDTLPNATIKTKKGGIAYQVSWSYNSATPLMSEKKLFDTIFSYLKGYGYVDAYQPKTKKTTTRRKTIPTLTTTTTNLYGVPLINIQNPSVIKKGDLFYLYLKSANILESPCYISDYDPNTSIFSFTQYVKQNLPQYETIEQWRLRESIDKDKAFLCKTTDGGYFVNSDNTFSLMIEPMKSDGSFEMIVNENGAERKGGLPNEEQLAMFICANRLMPKLPPTQQTTTISTTSQNNLNVVDDVVIANKILKVGDEFYYNAKIKKGTRQKLYLLKLDNITPKGLLSISWIDENGKKHDIYEWISEVEAQIYVDNGTITFPKGTKSVTFEVNDIIWSTKYPNMILRVDMVDLNNANVKTESYTPSFSKFTSTTYGINNLITNIENGEIIRKKLQVGDVFETRLFENFTITKIDDLGGGERIVTYSTEGLTDKMTELGFINVLQNKEMCWARNNMVSQTSTSQPTTSSDITSLQYYDLISRVGDGKLYRVLNVVGINEKNDVFYDIYDMAEVVLEYYDSLTKSFEQLYITFGSLKKNFEEGTNKYLGQVREGDSFVAENNMERFVTKVEDYPHDVTFNITDLNFTPPRILNTETFVMNSFTKSLLNQGYRFNLRLGNTTTTQTPTPQVPTNVAPKPQISNSEVNALKKELADLIFLKSGISDLDFEDKMNISSEIYDVQKKVNDLNEKLFEQSVGDEQFFDKLFEQSFTPLRDRYDLVITENDLNEILSPSGEISDLNEELQVIVNSKEFKEWFGDWRNAFFYRNLPDFGGLNISKVLNDKFEPQIVWHGTNNEFSYFDFEMFPANYFAVNKEYSEFFAINKGGRGYVLPFFLDIKNPLDLTSFGNNFVSTKDFFDWMYLMTGMSADELEVNPMFLDPNYPSSPIWHFIRNNPTTLQKIAKGRVYDGIKFYEFNPNEKNNPDKKAYETLAYIIFDPHQAKLADPSRGEILLASLKSFMLKRGGKI